MKQINFLAILGEMSIYKRTFPDQSKAVELIGACSISIS